MKKINKITKFIAAAAFIGATVSSCSLDLLPLNEVVLENFWTNKDDVQSIVTSCYCGLQEEGYVKNLIIWGEVRSDNVDNGKTQDLDLQDLQVGNIRTTASFTNWEQMYNVINRCNIVLNYAPQVAEKDPNYTESDLQVNIAEVKAIRAITYLNLIKAFKDVPFTLEPSIDDNQDYQIPATKFEDVVDALIEDLEPVKDWAPKKNVASGGYLSGEQSNGRITRAAMYSILAELYLWKASNANLDKGAQAEAYRKCVERCDWVINYKKTQYKTEDFESSYVSDLSKTIDLNVLAEYDIPLIAEEKGSLGSSSGSSASAKGGEAFEAIFVDGNSFESIFEITYHKTSNVAFPKNTAVPFIYGGYVESGGNFNRHSGRVHGNNKLLSSKPTGTAYNDKDLFTVPSDYRTITSFAWADGGTFPIMKYTGSFASSRIASVGTAWAGLTEDDMGYWSASKLSDSRIANWIVYRLTEILLFRAEAEIELARIITPVVTPDEEGGEEGGSAEAAPRTRSIIGDGAAIGSPEELYADAFNLIRCVYDRSNPQSFKDKGKFVPLKDSYTTYESYHTLLMNERRREFLFEGKRYFDLVREARREGNTKALVSAISDKFGGASQAVKVKMGMMDFMYLPYNREQIKVNPNLKQNPAFEDDDEPILN